MASIPSGGRFKPNRATYRAVLKSSEIADVCHERAESYDGYRGAHTEIRDLNDGKRVKTRVYGWNPDALGGARSFRN